MCCKCFVGYKGLKLVYNRLSGLARCCINFAVFCFYLSVSAIAVGVALLVIYANMDENEKSNSKAIMITGSVIVTVGGVVFILCIVGSCIFYRKVREQMQRQKGRGKEKLETFSPPEGSYPKQIFPEAKEEEQDEEKANNLKSEHAPHPGSPSSQYGSLAQTFHNEMENTAESTLPSTEQQNDAREDNLGEENPSYLPEDIVLQEDQELEKSVPTTEL